MISLLIIILISISIVFGCSKSNEQWTVYSVEILFNNQNNQDFSARIGEKFNISITVNDYKLSYKFSIFYAWIDYNDSKIELNYGDNVISFDKAGNYQVKVTIVDLTGYLTTKSMPFNILEDVDDEPPQIKGDILNNTLLRAYPNIGLILPDFEIIDNKDGKIEPKFDSVHGKIMSLFEYFDGLIDFYDTHNTWIYNNKKASNDQFTITGRDKKGNESKLEIKVDMLTALDSLYNWCNISGNWINSEISDDNKAIIGENALLYSGNEFLSATYQINYKTNNKAVIGYNTKDIYDNSILNIKYQYQSNGYYEQSLINIDFNQQIIIFNESDYITLSDNADNLYIYIENDSIAIKDINDQTLYELNIENSINSLIFELKNIHFFAEIY